MKILTIALVLISVFLSLKHGWDAIRPASTEQAKMMADLGVSINLLPYIGWLSIAIGLLLLIPQTYFISNLINAFIILLIMALSLRSGNAKIALVELPFLVLPLLLIWLKYPFKV
jgi:membrane-associated protease RseP (regulator of RpoE activity)